MAKGTADMQGDLARAKVGVEIAGQKAEARKSEADGEAEYITKTGQAKSAEVRAVGLARAEAYKAQVEALGQQNTAIVNIMQEVKEGAIKITPDILVNGGNGKK